MTPSRAGTDIGPGGLIRASWNRISKYIGIGKTEGSRLVFGGEAPQPRAPASICSRPLFTFDVTNKMRIAREEIFGTLALSSGSGLRRSAGNRTTTRFWLSSGICHHPAKVCQRLKRNSEAGMVMVNCRLPASITTCRSAAGRIQLRRPANRALAAEFYTTVKKA